MKIKLAMANQQVVDMKVELEKAKEVAQAAMDASGKKFYDLRVKETEACLTDELAGVCKDYYLEVWTDALNLIEVPAASEWWKVENIYYPQDLREALEALLGPETDVGPAIIALEQLLITHATPPPPPPEISKGPGKADGLG